MLKKVVAFIMTGAIVSSVFMMGSGVSASKDIELKDDSHIFYSDDGAYLMGIDGTIEADELRAQFSGDITLKSPDNKELTGKTLVPSGSVVTAGDKRSEVIIYGDVDQDGMLNASDVILMMKSNANWQVELYEPAFDVTIDGQGGTDDVIALMKYSAGWNIVLGRVRIIVDEAPAVAANEDSSLNIWLDHNTAKYHKTNVSDSGRDTYVIYMAKNEIEGAQVLISTEKDRSGLTVGCTDFRNEYGETLRTEICTEHYTKCGDLMYPDALVPSDKYGSIKMDAGTSQAFYVKAHAERNSREGLYRAVMNVYDGIKTVKTVNIYVNIWNFELSDETACATAASLQSYSVAGEHSQLDPNEIYKVYYDFLLENRLNAYVLPYSLNDDRVKQYLDNPRVTSFDITGTGYGGYMDPSDSYIKEAYSILSKNEKWAEKGFFYYVDEPTEKVKLDEIKTVYDKLIKNYPGAKMISPYFVNHNLSDIGMSGSGDMISYLSNYIGVWCTKIYAYTPVGAALPHPDDYVMTAEQVKKYGTFQDRMNAEAAGGDRVWWYFCWEPAEQYPSFFINKDGISHRIGFWDQYLCDVTGALYYAVDCWSNYLIWRSLETTNSRGQKVYGDGVLIYPGSRYKIDGPISSFRFESFRDGVEDYQYLIMLEELRGEAEVNKYVNNVTTSVLDYTNDDDLFQNNRIALGNYLETLLAK